MPIHNAFILRGSPGGQAGGQPSARGLQLTGPTLSVEIGLHPNLIQLLQQQGQQAPSPVAGLGLIDTGAGVTAVDVSILQSLQIQPVGVVRVGTAGGQTTQQRYPATVRFPELGFEGRFTSVIGADLTGQGIIALIGRDVLSRALLVYNGSIGHFILSL